MVSQEDIVNMVAEAFNMDAGALTVNSHRDEVEEWDSMGVLMLMAELDERFGILLEEDGLAELETVEDIVNLIGKAQSVAN